MNDAYRAQMIALRNRSFEGMLAAQYMRDAAVTEFEKRLADRFYELEWAAYNLLIETEKMKRE